MTTPFNSWRLLIFLSVILCDHTLNETVCNLAKTVCLICSFCKQEDVVLNCHCYKALIPPLQCLCGVQSQNGGMLGPPFSHSQASHRKGDTRSKDNNSIHTDRTDCKCVHINLLKDMWSYIVRAMRQDRPSSPLKPCLIVCDGYWQVINP